MAQFKISLPVDFKQMIADDTRTAFNDIAGRVLPDYSVFVWNLAKNMNTPAEELHHACTGMADESGEALGISKKVWVYGKALDVPHLVEELGDLRFYYQAALNMLGMTDAEIIAQNIKKLRVRYADGKYSDAQANARADKALSAIGSKGTSVPPPRKFMSPSPAENINDMFDAEMNASLRQLKRDEQP